MEALVRLVAYGKPAVQAKLVPLRYCRQALRRMLSYPAGFGRSCIKSKNENASVKGLEKFTAVAEKFKDPETRPHYARRWAGRNGEKFGKRVVSWAELWEIVRSRPERSTQGTWFICTTSKVAGRFSVWMNDEWFVKRDFPYRRPA